MWRTEFGIFHALAAAKHRPNWSESTPNTIGLFDKNSLSVTDKLTMEQKKHENSFALENERKVKSVCVFAGNCESMHGRLCANTKWSDNTQQYPFSKRWKTRQL